MIGADLCGVDLLPTPAGEDVVEVNPAVDVDHEDSLAGRDFYVDAAAALSLATGRETLPTRCDRSAGRAGVRSARAGRGRRPPAR